MTSWVDDMYPMHKALAAAGDLESRAWVADYEVAIAKELQAKQAKAKAAVPVQLGLLETPPDAAPKPKRRPRGMSEGTARCIRVAAGVLHSEGKPERGGGAAFARRALERAAELGHPWSDELSPDTMREVAEALLLGIKDDDEAPGTKPR